MAPALTAKLETLAVKGKGLRIIASHTPVEQSLKLLVTAPYRSFSNLNLSMWVLGSDPASGIGLAQVQAAEEPHFEPVKAGEVEDCCGGYAKEQRRAERGHEDATQNQGDRDAQAQHRAAHEETAG